MREQCIPNLVESWFQILQTYQQTHPELTCQCLEVVGAFVSWIELSLIANDRSVPSHRKQRDGESRQGVTMLVTPCLQVRECAAESDVGGGAEGRGLRLPV